MVGHRKLIVFVLVVVAGLYFTLTLGDIPPNLVTLLEWAGGFFAAGNMIEHYMAK